MPVMPATVRSVTVPRRLSASLRLAALAATLVLAQACGFDADKSDEPSTGELSLTMPPLAGNEGGFDELIVDVQGTTRSVRYVPGQAVVLDHLEPSVALVRLALVRNGVQIKSGAARAQIVAGSVTRLGDVPMTPITNGAVAVEIVRLDEQGS